MTGICSRAYFPCLSFGGNRTPNGASAHVIVVGMSGRAGKISFIRFVAYGLLIVPLTVCISMISIWPRHYLF